MSFQGPRDTLGGVIARFRKRLRHPDTGMPWSQEELAFAIGTDQAHISRIERNEKHPHYSTLVRICEALKLSRSERMYVFALAGYPESARPPDENEVNCVLANMVPLMESFPYPATLIDEAERIWHFNRVAIALWGPSFGIRRQERFLALARGERYLKMILDPGIYDMWKTYWDDVDGFLNRNIALLWRAHHAYPADPGMSAALEDLKKIPEFQGRWEAIEGGKVQALFIEHGEYVFRHPELGPVRYATWRTHAAQDERFVVTHCTPMDEASARAFRLLASGVVNHVLGRSRKGRPRLEQIRQRSQPRGHRG